ncbi:hypothetical protein [Flocculibacter collagenilyticus]|uniref:hypothetical protein n=1 Tax=Flocculibacter collagenilyticus TaxID=2744479 RepID=UPI0018F6461D|nr:hypothetical protein [Flocculibacter collagenilyticus]
MRLLLVALIISIVLLIPHNTFANNSNVVKSKQDAVRVVKKQVQGKVLKVEKVNQNFKVRMLTKKGVVTTLVVTPNGRVKKQ